MIGRAVPSPACPKATLDAYCTRIRPQLTLKDEYLGAAYSRHNGLGVVKDDSHLVVSDPPDFHERPCDLGYLKA